MRRRIARLGALGVTSIAAMFVAVPAAQAEITFQTSFGSSGSGAGRLSTPGGIAINNASGDLYVADRGNNRIDQFNSSRAFVRTWGYDVVKTGTDNKAAANEVEEVRIKATGGSFALSFQGQTTAQLPYDATPGAVQTALNGLSTISAGGGSVTVGGGPGDPSGAHPYVVTFSGGPLVGADLDLGIDTSGLGIPSGTQLTCQGGPTVPEGFAIPLPDLAYQWLANGDPVSGATASTFTPGAGEAGKAIQCQVAAALGPIVTMAASRPYALASPAPSPLPPLGPASLAAPTGTAIVDSAGGVPLTCSAGTWTRNPDTYTYQWFRNGAPIGSPTTTTDTSNDHTLTQADLASQAVFQCAVTGNNAGGSSTTISDFLPTDPIQKQPKIRNATAAVAIAPVDSSKLYTRANGGPVFEVCNANPPSNDVCQKGAAGNGIGQLDAPSGIAVDNSAGGAGAVYAIDAANPRVQKFSSSGAPIMAFGRDVDQATDGDVCTVASGDACGPGIHAAGFPLGSFELVAADHFGTEEAGNQLAVDGAGNVYVGDPTAEDQPARSRIQKFDSSGAVLGQVKIPSFQASNSVAADSTQRVYASLPYSDIPAVERFGTADFSAGGEGAVRPGNVFHQDGDPVQLALDPRNDRMLVSDDNKGKVLSACGGPATSSKEAIVEYDPSLNRLDCSIPTGTGSLPQIAGMAATKTGLLYVTTGTGNSIKVFQLPTSTPPSISAQSVTGITTETAQVHAQINPGFENTDYTVEYGTSPCTDVPDPCASATGGTVYGLKDIDGTTAINGLTPNTTYHYRVIAQSPLGTATGTDHIFTTFPLVDLVNDSCPNALARKQTKTVGLLDCRAYELASAAFAGGYDVESNLVAGQTPFVAYPDAQGELLYGIHNGGIPGTGSPTNRGVDPYLAIRGADGWSTTYKGIPADNPFATSPFSSTLSGAGDDLGTLAFSGPEICNPCFADGSAGIPVRMPNGDLVQGMAGSNPQLSAVPAGHVAKQLSADGEHLIFGSSAQFENAGNGDGKVSIYERDLKAATTEVVSTLPDGSTIDGPNPAGELDVSSNGSRVLVGEQISTDSAGNSYWHPYLHIAGQSHSIDLAPGAIAGVLFNGMSADGTKVFFTTTDELLPAQDTDQSADIYEAEVDKDANFSLRLVTTDSTGAASNNDGCAPAGSPATWNSPSGDGKCGALAFAGGAGLASSGDAFYFLSPEKLDPAKGILNQPNLYVSVPGSPPRFVATIDTSVGKPGPPGPTYPLATSNFGASTYAAVQALAVDQSNGDLYALDGGDGSIHRYDSSGAPDKFSAGPDANTNTLTGFNFDNPSAAQVAVDNSGAAHPFDGDFYVASLDGVGVYAPSGAQLGTLTGSGTSKGAFGEACGVAVDQSSGAVYVGDSAGFIWRYAPVNASGPVTDANYTVKGIAPTAMSPCAVAADSAGHVYASDYFDGPVDQFLASSFATGAAPAFTGTEIDASSRALATDPTTNQLYVDEGDRISVFDSSGNQVTTIGSGKLACGFLGSRGVAVNVTSHHVYAACFSPASIKEFGYVVPPYTPVDNPAILHAAQAEDHSYGDFQVSADGSYAAFATVMALRAGYDNANRYEVYRYGASADQLTCVSCNPTGSQALSDSGLPHNGLGLLEDGRVFFDTGEQLTLRDTNGKLDAYEWSGGAQQLISTGSSAFPSGLLGVSSDGTDAFFFTRDVLVDSDRNGQAMKVYDARSGGGFFVIPPPPPCAASDECHGPGSQAAPPSQLGTHAGTGGNCSPASSGCGGSKQATKPCRKGKTRRHGRCVTRKPKKPRHRHRARGAHRQRGGVR